jgi:type IV pilus assembly protein PilC
MPAFQYKAHREDQTVVEGRIAADDLDAARLMLEGQGLVVETIRQVEVVQAAMESPRAGSSTAHPAEAERRALQRQFGRILETGRPLAPALLAYAEELPPGSRRRRLQRIADQLEQGHDPSHEFAAGQIDEQWMHLLSASASSGDAGQILSGIIDESERDGELRGQLAGAFAYPLLLLLVLFAVMCLFSWWLVPSFQDLFNDFDCELPELTQFVFGLSEAIRESHGLVLLVPGLLLLAVFVFIAVGPRSALRDWIIRRIPIIRSTVWLSDRARFTRCLADLMEAEVPAADALRISGRNAGHAALRQEANRLATEIEVGGTELPGAPGFRGILPHTAIHVMQLDAETGAAAAILRELSWMYDQQTRNRLGWVSSVASPVFVVVLGIMVGLYVIALFLPLIGLVQALS